MTTRYVNHKPECNICSFKQPRPETPRPIYHFHSSSRQVRVLQHVELDRTNPPYFCPTCQTRHAAKIRKELNVCVSTSQLDGFHFPRDRSITCPPDSTHVDWLTIPGARIEELTYAWRLDYHREVLPMRVVLVAGLNDLVRGGTVQSVTSQIERFKDNVDAQNYYHPGSKNTFAVAPLLLAPKLVWFPDNGREPPRYVNRMNEVVAINDWIAEFNRKNDMGALPRFHTWGHRTSIKKLRDGSRWEFQTHRWNEWRVTEPDHDKLHLTDKMRVKMGQNIIKYFEGEYVRNGPLA